MLLEVKRKNSLTVDKTELVTLENVMANCDNFEKQKECQSTNAATSSMASDNTLATYDDNGNGRILSLRQGFTTYLQFTRIMLLTYL